MSLVGYKESVHLLPQHCRPPRRVHPSLDSSVPLRSMSLVPDHWRGSTTAIHLRPAVSPAYWGIWLVHGVCGISCVRVLLGPCVQVAGYCQSGGHAVVCVPCLVCYILLRHQGIYLEPSDKRYGVGVGPWLPPLIREHVQRQYAGPGAQIATDGRRQQRPNGGGQPVNP